MRRAKRPPAQVQVLPRAVLDLAKEKLSDDWLGFVAGTSEDDPKRYVGRMEAANAAYDMLERIGGAGEPPEAEADDVLRSVRLDIASEQQAENTS